MIPKILMQTSKFSDVPDYVRKKFEACLGEGWTYIHFNDQEIIEYLEKYALTEFPNIVSQFYLLEGPHKADLFRYFFIYNNGGVYVDTDAMLYSNINYLVEGYDFFTVKTGSDVEQISSTAAQAFNGFIGAVPNNDIIKKALYDAYTIDPDRLKVDYHLLCKNLSVFIAESNSTNVKLLIEKIHPLYSVTFDPKDLNSELLIHYSGEDKIIPV